MKDNAPFPTILILGGQAGEAEAMETVLADGFDCLRARNAASALELMAENFVQVVICAGDINERDGAEMFEQLRSHWPETLFVAVSDPGEDPRLTRAQTLEHILLRPWTGAELQVAAASACRSFALRRENERLSLEMRYLSPTRRQVPGPAPGAAPGFDAILRLPNSPLTATISAARQYASFDVPVLLLGEPGTGRAEMARAIHLSSLRSDKPFQQFDCTGLTDAAIAAALFGAPGGRAGIVRRADHGSLYIAGLETLSPDMQVQILRLVRDGTYVQTGTAELQSCGARLIASATDDLRCLVDGGSFRADLFYALAVAELSLPPLRERRGDLPLLARALAEDAARTHRKAFRGISEAAMAFITAYPWPGNLRELENELTRMLVLAQDPVLGPELLSRHILQSEPSEDLGADDDTSIMTCDRPLKDRVEAIEARILRETLTRLKWNKSRSAAELGLSRVGLRAKLDRYGIAPPAGEPEEADACA